MDVKFTQRCGNLPGEMKKSILASNKWNKSHEILITDFWRVIHLIRPTLNITQKFWERKYFWRLPAPHLTLKEYRKFPKTEIDKKKFRDVRTDFILEFGALGSTRNEIVDGIDHFQRRMTRHVRQKISSPIESKDFSFRSKVKRPFSSADDKKAIKMVKKSEYQRASQDHSKSIIQRSVYVCVLFFHSILKEGNDSQR